uniref:SKIP_SNW domain-containing protein n=1 Tax=Steinernema glaseri TaxID=37863 RepID=A0A1I7Y2S3_9BILA
DTKKQPKQAFFQPSRRRDPPTGSQNGMRNVFRNDTISKRYDQLIPSPVSVRGSWKAKGKDLIEQKERI